VAGRSGYSLTCVVTADIAPEVKWRDGNNNQIYSTNRSVFVSRPVVSGRTTRLTLNFNSLRTSHGASYSCLSNITVPSSVQVARRDTIVKSEFIDLHYNNIMLHDNLHNVMFVSVLVPPPTVRVVHQPDEDQYFATESVDLICLSDISLAVDTPISVGMTWYGSSGNRTQSDGHISVLGDRGSFTEHDSTLRFSLLRSSDSDTYTCTSIASSTSRYVVASEPTSAESSINASAYSYRQICCIN
jgi:hypothetical protein